MYVLWHLDNVLFTMETVSENDPFTSIVMALLKIVLRLHPLSMLVPDIPGTVYCRCGFAVIDLNDLHSEAELQKIMPTALLESDTALGQLVTALKSEEWRRLIDDEVDAVLPKSDRIELTTCRT